MNNPTNDTLPPAEDVLEYQGKVLINFPISTYQWVDIKLFSLPTESITDLELLGLLLRHVRYRDSYATSKDEDAVDIHGPYRLNAITVDRLTEVDPANAKATLHAWAEQWAPIPEPVRVQFEQELWLRISAATSLYELTGLGKAEQHEWGGVVGFSGFHEFVAIDRDVGVVALVVASDD